MNNDKFTLPDLIDAAARVVPKEAPAGRVCRECKWWRKGRSLFGKVELCSNEKLVRPSGPRFYEELHDRIMTLAETQHPLYTGPDFCCVHWEEHR